MARPLRIEFPGAVYHVTARGNERKPIYRGDRDRRRFLTILADVIEQFHLLLHAYVLMDNYHLLVETLAANRSRAMRALKHHRPQRRLIAELNTALQVPDSTASITGNRGRQPPHGDP